MEKYLFADSWCGGQECNWHVRWTGVATVRQVRGFPADAHVREACRKRYERFRHVKAGHQVANTVMHAAAETKMGRSFFFNIEFGLIHFARITPGGNG